MTEPEEGPLGSHKGYDIDLTNVRWRQSKRAAAGIPTVEVAFVDGAIVVRDSKDPKGPILVFTKGEWDAFVAGAKDGEFDL